MISNTQTHDPTVQHGTEPAVPDMTTLDGLRLIRASDHIEEKVVGAGYVKESVLQQAFDGAVARGEIPAPKEESDGD